MAKAGTDRAPTFSARCYYRSTARKATAESKSPSKASIDLEPIKTEHYKSSYRIFTSMHIDERSGLNRSINHQPSAMIERNACSLVPS